MSLETSPTWVSNSVKRVGTDSVTIAVVKGELLETGTEQLDLIS